MTRHATHPASCGIMHNSAQQAMVLILFGGSDARLPRRRRKETSFLHPQRSENMSLRILIERLAGEPLDESFQHDEIDVAVNKSGARWPLRSQLKRHAIRGVFAFPLFDQVQVFG